MSYPPTQPPSYQDYQSQPPHHQNPQASAPNAQYTQHAPTSQHAPQPNNPYANPLPGPRILNIYEEGLTHRHRQILDTDKSTPLYKIHANSGGLLSSKPHVTFTSAVTNAVIGTASFHQIIHDVELQVHGQPIVMQSSSLLGSSHEFVSPAAGGQRFKWKRDGLLNFGDLVCLDEAGGAVAWYECSTFAVHKEGKLMLAPGVEGMLMDEMVVSGVAMLDYKRRENNKQGGG